MRVRILPNVSCHEVRATTNGTIVRCLVSDNAQIATGDTLLVYTDGNRLCSVVSPQNGTVRFLRFCVPGESIKSDETLFEVCSSPRTERMVYAVIDTLPSNVNLSQASVCMANVGNTQLTFQKKQTQSDAATGITRVLLQSEQTVAIAKEVTIIVQMPTKSGSLLDQLIGDRFP